VRTPSILATGATGTIGREPLKSNATVKTQRAPSYVRFVNLILKGLLRIRIPISPMVSLTVNGRNSGKQRTTLVVRFKLDGHSYLFSFFGESNWVRNLRAAGKAAVRGGLKQRVVTAVELTHEEATAVLKNSLTPYLESPLMGRLIRSNFHVTWNSSLEEWSDTARFHPVFEVRESMDTSFRLRGPYLGPVKKESGSGGS
jgi:deazaflavin-dependent oxidoreductase (nitroreductase family)